MTFTAGAAADIEQVVAAFENGTIGPAEFGHEQHLLVAWHYLQDGDLLDALTRFTAALRRLTIKLGVPSKYHETITWFYMIQIAQRLSCKSDPDWPAFKADNPDLFEWNPSLVQKYYSDSLLASEAARHRFVFPDLTA